MSEWSFPTNHAHLYRARSRGAPREIAATVGIGERRAWGIIDNLAQTGYIVKEREGRRNSYKIQVNAPLDEAVSRPQTIGQLMTFCLDHRALEGSTQSGLERAAGTSWTLSTGFRQLAR